MSPMPRMNAPTRYWMRGLRMERKYKRQARCAQHALDADRLVINSELDESTQQRGAARHGTRQLLDGKQCAAKRRPAAALQKGAKLLIYS